MKEKQMFSDIIERFHKNKNTLKAELKQAIINGCETYGDVERYLNINEQEVRWNGDKLAMLLITELREEFNREKNNLSLQ
ncbi:hypothetical protein [Bacillus paramycoides]|uniref:hypothetical protein n=1 Tax=Bacillus paramycoides TaxID=2026194 RepID=UPI002E1B179A|nr:hypothetical protein [Bacillus paramycoides]